MAPQYLTTILDKFIEDIVEEYTAENLFDVMLVMLNINIGYLSLMFLGETLGLKKIFLIMVVMAFMMIA